MLVRRRRLPVALRVPFIFTGYQKQPRHRTADDRRSQSSGSREHRRSNVAFPPPHPARLYSLPFRLFLPPRFFSIQFFFLVHFSQSSVVSLSLSRVLSLLASLAFLRVVRAYEFDFTRFPSIVERRKLFLRPDDLALPFSTSSSSSCSFGASVYRLYSFSCSSFFPLFVFPAGFFLLRLF